MKWQFSLIMRLAFLQKILMASCPIYSCDPQPSGNTCARKEFFKPTEKSSYATMQVKLLMTPCKNSDEVCPYSKLSKKLDKINCVKPVITSSNDLKSYPGQYCNGDYLNPFYSATRKCFNDYTCENNVCLKSSMFGSCFTPGDCPVGFTCKKTNVNSLTKMICMLQSTIGETCERDEDCLNSLGCYSLTMKCIPYFSLANGETERVGNFKNLLSLCKSGQSYNNTCLESSNINTECTIDGVCMYKSSNDPNLTFKLDTCDCALDESGKRFCQYGSNFIYYKRLIEIYKDIINTGSCHSVERVNCFKSFDEKYLEINVKKKFQFYRFKATKSHIVKDPSSCIAKTIFPNMIEILPEPDPILSCPKFTCEEDSQIQLNQICMERDFKDSIVTYKFHKCHSEQLCILDSANLFKNEDPINSVKCNSFSVIDEIESSGLPGEPCETTDDCKVNNCIDGYCYNGKKIDISCMSHGDCFVGLYCDSISRVCKGQKYQGESCMSEYECRNNMGCYASKCVEYYSLEVGADMNVNEISGSYNTDPTQLCKFGYVDDKTKQCSYLKFESPDKMVDGLLKCDLNSKCRYLNHKNAIVEEYCQCGYNTEGQGYCPFSHDNEKKWLNYFYQIRVNRNNLCHTLNRFNCKFVPKKFKENELKLRHETKLLSMIKNTDKCVIEHFFENTEDIIKLRLWLSIFLIIVLVVFN